MEVQTAMYRRIKYIFTLACKRRFRILLFASLCLLLCVMVVFTEIGSTVGETHTAVIGDIPKSPRACIVPSSYAPTGPGTCVLTANGTIQVVPGAVQPWELVWNESECEATMHRLAPWLRPRRRDLAAAPPLLCSSRGNNNQESTPLFIVEKTQSSYVFTEPLWASLSVAGESTSKDKRKNAKHKGKDDGCPSLYLTSHTHGFGQTFNQLQSIVSAIWLSKVFNRTYVFPLFTSAYDESRLDVPDTLGTHRTGFERYFSVDKLREAGYCVATYSAFEADIRRRFPDEEEREMVYYENVQQWYYKTFFINGMVDVAPLLAPPAASIPPLRFSYSFGKMYDAVPADNEPPAQLPSAPLVMIDNLVGFCVRAPFTDQIHIMGLLEPSALMAATLKKELRAHANHRTIALHLRNREGICAREQYEYHRHLWPPTAASPLKFERSCGTRFSILEECPYTAWKTMERVRFAIQDLLPYMSSSSTATKINPKNVSILIATDRQHADNLHELHAMLQREHMPFYQAGDFGNILTSLTEFEKKLFGVFFDFFVLVRADVFYGNRMSSVSQCVCEARLGQGRACHATPAGHLRSLLFPDMVHVLESRYM